MFYGDEDVVSSDEESSCPATLPVPILLPEFDVQDEALRRATEELAEWNSQKEVDADFLSGKQLKWKVYVGSKWVMYDKSVHGNLRSHAKKQKVTDDKDFNVLDHLREAADKTRHVVEDGIATQVKVYPYLILLFLSILGCPAHAANPERFFRLCGLICTALRAALGAYVLMMLSFLKYNKEFMPTDSEVAVEYYRRRDLKREERRAANLEKKRKEREGSADANGHAEEPVGPAEEPADANGPAADGSEETPISLDAGSGSADVGAKEADGSPKTDLNTKELKSSTTAEADSIEFEGDLYRMNLLDFEVNPEMEVELMQIYGQGGPISDAVFGDFTDDDLPLSLLEGLSRAT